MKQIKPVLSTTFRVRYVQNVTISSEATMNRLLHTIRDNYDEIRRLIEEAMRETDFSHVTE